MTRRTTKNDIQRTEAIINKALEKSGVLISVQGRYGYQGIDLYNNRGCLRTIRTGLTKGQALDYLNAMLEGIFLYTRKA